MPGAVRPSPRNLAWLALAGVGIFLALLDPGSRGPGVAPDPRPDARLLPEESPWLDRARLGDPAMLVTPPVRADGRGTEVSVPEAAPFPPIPPDLRSSPQGLLHIPSAANPPQDEPEGAIQLPSLNHPFETLGERVARGLPPARAPICRASSLDGTFALERSLESESEFKYLIIKILGKNSPPVIGLGIDAFGLQGSPVLLSGTGSPDLDLRVIQWASRQPWASWLPPGAYRIEFGP